MSEQDAPADQSLQTNRMGDRLLELTPLATDEIQDGLESYSVLRSWSLTS
ncbi:hypothetical protein G9463_23775 [Haloarcula sp. JP-Z28]|nr:hypothetical protein [Haloarcula sp. JP-Z28]NHN66218.1 hypothetical protein [Haloarcula sp. JP-Z28]